MYTVPRARQVRAIISSDVANEADDQYAIVHALLTPKNEHHYDDVPARLFGADCSYIEWDRPGDRTIRVYRAIDSQMILEDFYAKLRLHANATAGGRA